MSASLLPSPEAIRESGPQLGGGSVASMHEGIRRHSELGLPEAVLENPHALVHEIIGEIRTEFDSFWNDRVREAEEQGGMFVKNRNRITKAERERYDKIAPENTHLILDTSDRLRSFQSEILWADFLITKVFALDEEQPGSQLVIDFDIDEVIGKQLAQADQEWLKHLPEVQKLGINYKNPVPEHIPIIRKLSLEEQAKRMVFRPALGPVTRLLFEKLNFAEERIRFGLSSSHAQEEMHEYLAPRLQELCGGFVKFEMMSSRDSPIAQKVRDDMALRLMELQEAAAKAGQEIPVELTYVDMIEVYPELRGLFDLTDATTLKKLANGQLDKQGIKPFMAARRVREASEEGRYGDTVVAQIDDWPLFAAAANKSAHVRIWHVGKRLRFVLPGERGYTNPNEMRALLGSLGMKARHT